MFKLLFLTLLLSTIGAIAGEMYVPSLPYIAASFHVNHSLIQYSLTFYMLGTVVPALFLGALADIYGRRPVVMISLVIGLIGTLGCLFAKNIIFFIFSRFIEGLGFSATNGLGRALLRDYCEGEEFAKYSSYLSMGFAFSVDITPFLGGIFQRYFNWHSIFVFLVAFNLMSIIVAAKFPFKPLTNQKHQRTFSWSEIIQKYLVIARNFKFLQYAVTSALTYAVFMSYLSVASFLWETKLGLLPDRFGIITLLLSVCYIASCYLNSILVRFGMVNVLRSGLVIILVSGLSLLVLAVNQQVNLISFFGIVGFIFVGSGFIFSNSSALAMSSIHENFSSASALYSFISIIAGTVFSALISIFDSTHFEPLALLVMALALTGLLLEFIPKAISIKSRQRFIF